jgi:hypothetical protein
MTHHSHHTVFDTLHVNLWGIPGTGKQFVARELVALLTQAGAQVEVVQEYAKELGWAGQLVREDGHGDLIEIDQFLISSEQYRRENLLHGVCQVVVTEAPVLAGVLYAHEDDETELRALLRRRTSGWRNLDILLESAISHEYGSRGRIQNREESIAMMPRITDLLVNERPSFVRMGVAESPAKIANMVVRELKGAHHPAVF